MVEKGPPIRLEKGPDACGFEGVGQRPDVCPNNPWRFPENYRPRICQQCPTNQNIWRTALDKLPQEYIEHKQNE